MSKRGRNTNSKLSIGAIVGLIALGSIAGWVAIAAFVGLLTQGKDFAFIVALWNGIADYRVWVFFISACVCVGIVFAVRSMQSGKRVLKVNDIEDTHWMTNAEVKKSKNMTLTSFSRLGDVADGVPVYVSRQGKDLTIVLAKAIHTLGIGTTGSGKTTTFIEPTIQILCRTKTKPSMVITDPKGELYRNHAATLHAQGYDVLVLNIAEPYRSARWNPFAAVIEKTRQIKEAESKMLGGEVVQKNGKYIDRDGVVHDTFEEACAAESLADIALKVFIQDLKDEIFVDLQDVVYTICPITSQQEPVWEQGARNFIFALTVAMWEDLLEGGCEESEFNLHTLYKNVSDYAKGDLPVLSEYLTAGRDEFSLASGLANAILTSEDKQLSSYLSQVNNYMVGFADSGIRRLTSGNDIDIGSFDEKPTALFIQIPDEKENRHFIVTLMITQLYKVLVNKARQNYRNGETKYEELKRNVYVIMDEFGNMPKFPSIDKIITVGRSRHIFMLPIIQDYGQLDNKYGKELAGIIKSNCNIKIFIGSTDDNTIKEFSELCGKTKQRNISFGDGTSISSFNVNTSAQSVPLIYPTELEHLNDPPRMGNAIVLAFGKNPIRAKYEAVFSNRNIYKPEEEVLENNVEPQVFDEAAHYYNFASRSVWIARSSDFAAKQFAEAQRTVDELFGATDPDPPQAFDPMNGADERLLPLMLSIKGKVPQKIAIKLEAAFFDHDLDGICDACIAAMEYAQSVNKRWLRAESAKLKNIIQQLAARKPLEIGDSKDVED